MGLEKNRFRDEYRFVMFDSECRHARRVVSSAVAVFGNRLVTGCGPAEG